MHLARAANSSVERVSLACSAAGDTAATITVRALPPRQSWSAVRR